MDMQIIKLDGTSYFLKNHDIIVKDFVVESMESKDTFIEQDGVHGRTLVDTVYTKRKINVPCFFIAENNADYATQRSLLYRLVESSEPFYIRELRKTEHDSYDFHDLTQNDSVIVDDFGRPIEQHAFDDFVDGKRYLVKLSGAIKPSQKYYTCNCELEFETVKLPFSESIGTSLDLEKRQQDGMWSEDMLIDFDDVSKTTYTFNNVSEGRIYYHGTQANAQYNMDCIVTIVVAKKTNNLSWTLSNGDLMYIKDIDLDVNDVIKYDGLRVTKNGVPITEKTGLTMPKFTHGFNHFKFNQSVKKAIFDMRFYFV